MSNLLSKYTRWMVSPLLLVFAAYPHTAGSQEIAKATRAKSQDRSRTKARTMIEAKQALKTAVEAAAKRMDLQAVVDIVVEPSASHYRITLIPSAPVDTSTSEAVLVEIDADSGKLTGLETSPRPNPILRLQAELRGSRIVSGLEAHQAALDAIKGYETYDKLGRLEIRLDQDHYEVTFPDPSARAEPRGLGPDYAYQIWIDVKTKAVKKLLAAS